MLLCFHSHLLSHTPQQLPIWFSSICTGAQHSFLTIHSCLTFKAPSLSCAQSCTWAKGSKAGRKQQALQKGERKLILEKATSSRKDATQFERQERKNLQTVKIWRVGLSLWASPLHTAQHPISTSINSKVTQIFTQQELAGQKHPQRGCRQAVGLCVQRNSTHPQSKFILSKVMLRYSFHVRN